MNEQTLAHIVENFRRRGSETAYVSRRGYRNLRWSYQQISDTAWRLAGALKEQGIGPGDRVFLWGEDCAEWVISFFGCVLRGAIVVPMDRTASLDFARRVCGQTEVRLSIGSAGQPKISESLPALIFEDFPRILAPYSTSPSPVSGVTAQDVVEIVFTSGTTSDPKGVVLSHKNILANLYPLEKEIAKYLKYEKFVHPVRFLNLLPLSHVFGQFLGLFIPQILGGTVVFQDSLNPSAIIRTIRRERVSVLVTVPRVLETLQDKLERDLEVRNQLTAFKKELHAAGREHFARRWWRFRRIHNQFGWKFWAFISGGASLGAESEKFWNRLGFAVIQGYGMTETTSLISVNHPFKLGKGSIGKVLPGREVRLAPDGEIFVRGDSIATGYYQGKELMPVPGQEGWFPTGDMGALDEQGNLYFKGRLKSVIVSPEGMKIYPEDIEAELRRQPGICECVVLGLDRGGNADVCAILILQDNTQDPERIIKSANESLAQHQQIRRWLVWPERDFPRTSTQKPQIPLIREYAKSQLLAQGGRNPATGTGVLADLISRVTGGRIGSISPQNKLSTDLNLSSLERVELLSAIEDRFQVDLNESRFTSVITVEDLEKMLGQPTQQRSDFHYPRWAQRPLIRFIRVAVYYLLSWPATMLMACPRVRGREHLSSLRSPVLFVSNHVTQVDVGFILAALPARFRHCLAVAMIGEMLQEMRHPDKNAGWIRGLVEKSRYGLVVALFNVFPLPQKTGFRSSFAFAGESVDRGFSILVFPEGRRTLDGTIGSFRAGVGLLANNLGLPVVPIRIDGLFHLKKLGKKVARPGTVSVTIGPAVKFDSQTDPIEIARKLEAIVLSLGSGMQ
jgi:long-chain acyl-CoA synthetase